MSNPAKLAVNESSPSEAEIIAARQARTKVVADTMSQSWRVLCPLHGEVSRYREFWPANRDAREHDSVCPLVTGRADGQLSQDQARRAGCSN